MFCIHLLFFYKYLPNLAGFLWHSSTLMLWTKFRHKFCCESAGFLWVEITNFFRHIHKGYSDLIMTLLSSLFIGASSPTDLYWKLLTSCFSHKLSWLFLHILCGTRWLIDSSALLRALAITDLFNRLIALFDCLIESLLFEGYRAELLKVLLTHLLLTRLKLGDICIMTLLCVFVSTLQDGLLFKTSHCFFLKWKKRLTIYFLMMKKDINVCYLFIESTSTGIATNLFPLILIRNCFKW